MVGTAALFISCEDNTSALKEINSDRQDPIGTASNIRMVYTDSIKIQAILTAPKHIETYRKSPERCRSVGRLVGNQPTE